MLLETSKEDYGIANMRGSENGNGSIRRLDHNGDEPMVEELVLAVGVYGAVKPPYYIPARSYQSIVYNKPHVLLE